MVEPLGQMFESVEIVFSESGSSELVMDRELLPKPIIQLGHPLGNELPKWKLVPLVPNKKPFLLDRIKMGRIKVKLVSVCVLR